MRSWVILLFLLYSGLIFSNGPIGFCHDKKFSIVHAQSLTTKDEVVSNIISLLEDYLDNSYEIKDTQLKFHKGISRMVKDLNEIVTDTLTPYEAYIKREFPGFSDLAKEKLSTLSKINWESKITGNVLVDSEAVGRDYIRLRMNELKQIIRSELILYSNDSIDDFGTTEPLVEDTDTTFNPTDPLIGIDHSINPMPESDLQLSIFKIDSIIADPTKEDIVINDDIAKRMLAIMASNNQLIEKISEEMSLMRVTIMEIKRDGEERDRAMYEDLNNKYLALRDAIASVEQGGSIDIDFSRTRPSENKDPLEIKFNYGSVYLTAANKVALNEVFSELLLNNKYKIIITGYADKSGNREQNIVLSQKRADAVKYHFKKMGISENRMVVNYLGDVKSASYNPDDRKVVIEWLEEVDSKEDIFGKE